MKHIFIINPKAGQKDMTEYIQSQLKKFVDKIDYEIYVTKGINDALEFTKDYCQTHDGALRFYACGGDGTLNEVVNGLIDFPNASIACYPIGSGNDFIKNFGTHEDFLNLNNLILGKDQLVDVFQVNDRYTINICNFGFDAVVADNMVKFKTKWRVKGKTAYNLAVFYSLLFKTKHECKITVDGKVMHNGKLLLCAVANGMCYGGGYYCAPLAKYDDGLLDINIVRTMSRFQFVSMIGKYKRGQHLDDKRISKYITYLQGKTLDIEAPNGVIYCIDGEVSQSAKMHMQVHPKMVRFVVPKK